VRVYRRHGMARHPRYRTWQQMMSRCYNPAHLAFANYGGRGIIVCPEWHDVRNYIEYVESVLGPCSSAEQNTVDRIDNDGNYVPGNLRWASKAEQNLNKRLRPIGVSGYRGVYANRYGTYEASLAGRYLGKYASVEDAVQAREVHRAAWSLPEDRA
jgi:hypothetical protein